MALELLAELGRKPGSAAKAKPSGMAMPSSLRKERDVELLTLDVDRIARIDRELRRDLRVELAIATAVGATYLTLG